MAVSNWMHVELFTVNQAAALWGGYDPTSLWMSDSMKPSEVVAAKQILLSCILGGELLANTSSNFLARIGDHSDSLVARGDLERIARKRSIFPAFLFDTLSPLAEPTDILHRHNRPLPAVEGVKDDPALAIPAPKPNRGGRPVEYDWDAFIGEIIRRANQPDGLPDKQADLVAAMLGWFANIYGKEPAESAVKHRISKIYRHLEQAKNTDREVSGLSG
jgi:hypothetical protein